MSTTTIEKNYVNSTTSHALKMILLILRAKKKKTDQDEMYEEKTSVEVTFDKNQVLYLAGKTYNAKEIKMDVIV